MVNRPSTPVDVVSRRTPGSTLRTRAGSRGIALAPDPRMRTIMLSLFGRARRRSLMPRLLTKRVPRRRPSVVGTCRMCGVQFAASRERRADTTRVLLVRESPAAPGPVGDPVAHGLQVAVAHARVLLHHRFEVEAGLHHPAEVLAREARVVRAHDAALLVDPRVRGNVHPVVELGDDVARVDEARVRRLRRLDPLADVLRAARIHGDRDDGEVPGRELLVECLPDRQVHAAPSPGGPGVEEYLPAAELGEAVEAAV